MDWETVLSDTETHRESKRFPRETRCFFFSREKDEAENQSTVKINVSTSPLQSEGPFTEPNQRTRHPARHPVRQECHHQHHTHTWQLKHRGCHSPGHRTSQDGAPPQAPSLLGTFSASSWSRLVPWLGPTEKQTVASLRTTDFNAQHDQAGSAVAAHQLGVRALLHPGCVTSCEDVTVPEVRFNTRSCLMLPAVPAASGLEVFPFTGCWFDFSVPRRRFKNRTLQSRGDAFQLVHHQLSDFGVAFADHSQAVGPTGPVSSLARL